MMMVYLRLFAGFTSFISNRARSHFFSIGPDGILESSCMEVYEISPVITANGMELKPRNSRIATTFANRRSIGVYRGWFTPSV